MPRRRFLHHPALRGLALLLLVSSCQDGVTEPDRQRTEAPRTTALSNLLEAAVVDPVSVTHFDGRYEDHAFVINDKEGLSLTQPSGVTIASVPLFDASLGELLSARLVIDGWLASRILAHGVNPFYVSNQYGASFAARANLDALLSTLTGQNQIVLQQSYVGFLEDFGNLADNLVAHVEEGRDDEEAYSFDQTFAGAAAQVFVQGGPGAPTNLTMDYTASRFSTARGGHSGFAVDQLFQIKTEPTGAGTKPGIGTLVQTVAALVFAFNSHNLYFSDLHGAGAAQFQMAVTYTYQPNRPPACAPAAPSAPEFWKPDGRFEPINVLGVTDPDGDPVAITITEIWQDEPTDSQGDGLTTPDALGVGTSTAQVRVERAGTSDGRVYHIGFNAEDGRGGICSGTVLVSVPHDVTRIAVDGGALYDSTK